MDLNIIWFLLIAVLLIGYAILDGFDLGVGVLHLFTKDENERRININSIAPVWDGNEVWLLTAGGALLLLFKFRLYLFHVIKFYYIAYFYVIIVFNADSAFKAVLDFLDVVFKPS